LTSSSIYSRIISSKYIYIYIFSHNNQSDYLCPCSGAGFLSRVRTSASQGETWAPKLPDRPVVTYYKRKSFSATAAEVVARDPSAWPIREQKRRGEENKVCGSFGLNRGEEEAVVVEDGDGAGGGAGGGALRSS
jgi:hypothetical protein